MKRLASLCLVTTLLLGASVAIAQPGAEPAPVALPPVVTPPVMAPVAAPPAVVPPIAEPPEVAQRLANENAALEGATTALVAGRFEEAIQRFNRLAISSTSAEIRGLARALFRVSQRLQAAHTLRPIATAPSRGQATAFENENGRASFVITTTGAAFYGSFGLLDLLGIEDFKPMLLTVTATTGAGMALSLYATQDKTISPATASAYSTGLMAGIANGLLLAPKLGIESDGEYGDGEVNQNYLLFGVASMTAGGALGALLATKFRPTDGQVKVISSTGLSGFATAGLLLAMMQPDSIDGDTLPMLLAGGMDLGLGVGAALAKDIDWSASRANYVVLSQVVGALGGFTLGALAADPINGDSLDVKLWAGTTLAGLWGGFALGVYATRNMNPDASMATTAPPSLSIAPLIGDNMQGLSLGGLF